MMWSKLKQTIEGRFADSLKGRVEVFNARYHHAHDDDSRGWITVDKREIANYDDVPVPSPQISVAFQFHLQQTQRDEAIPTRWQATILQRKQGVFNRRDFDQSL